jgi:DHA1 family bicyclomycin/chloramphenicol resistance-like MFS transporter
LRLDFTCLLRDSAYFSLFLYGIKPNSKMSHEKPTSSPKVHHFLTGVAALLAMLGPFSIDTYLPSFPDIEAEFGISRALLTQSLSLYLAAFALGTLFWGPLADRFGRKRIITLGLMVYVMAAAGCAMASDITAFLFWRVLQGFAASGAFVAGRAMIRDAHDPQSAQRAMAQVMLLFAMAPAIAPILGGWLHDHFGWRSVFWFLAAFGVLLIAMISLAKETLPPAHRQSVHPRKIWQVYRDILSNSRFLRVVFTLALAFGGLFIYIAGAPTVIYDFLGLGSEDFGFQFVPMVIGMMAGAVFSARVSHHWPLTRTVATGLAITLLASSLNLGLSLLTQPNLLTVIAPLVIYAFGIAMAMPAISVIAMDFYPRNRGSATSIQGFMQAMMNAAVASFLVPLLNHHWHYFAMAQWLFCLLAIGLWLSVRKTTTSK